MANRFDGRNRQRATKRHARELVVMAQECQYLPPPNCGKVPKGTVLKGMGEYDTRARLLDRAATEWLRSSKPVGRTMLNVPYRKAKGKPGPRAGRLHGSPPSTTL